MDEKHLKKLVAPLSRRVDYNQKGRELKDHLEGKEEAEWVFPGFFGVVKTPQKESGAEEK